MAKTPEERRNSRAATANSLQRAESLCVDENLMRRYAYRMDPEAYLIVESWEPRKSIQNLIVTVEVLDAN